MTLTQAARAARMLERWNPWRRKSAPSDTQAQTWQFRVERERRAVGKLNDSLEHALLPAIPEPALRALQVSLDELLTNVIMHAEQASGPIDVGIERTRETLDTEIIYTADEFDPTQWHSEAGASSIADSQVGGLGINLVRGLMDEFRHAYRDGRNHVYLRKRC